MSERNVLLKNVKHPFLVGLHFSFQTADKLYFVLDYINGGEVSSKKIISISYHVHGGRVDIFTLPFKYRKSCKGKSHGGEVTRFNVSACQLLNYQRILRPFPAIVLPCYIC